MKAKDLPKNKNKSVRINDEVLKELESQGYTLQSFLDEKLEENIKVNIKPARKALEKIELTAKI